MYLLAEMVLFIKVRMLFNFNATGPTVNISSGLTTKIPEIEKSFRYKVTYLVFIYPEHLFLILVILKANFNNEKKIFSQFNSHLRDPHTKLSKDRK